MASLGTAFGRRRLVVGTAGAGVLALGLALLPGGPAEQRAEAATLTPFAGCAELEDWFRTAAMDLVGPYGFDGGGVVMEAGRGDEAVSSGGPVSGGDAAVPPMGAPAAGTAGRSEAADGLAGPAVGSGPTGTNVQEAGVDEPDLVKTDGDLLFAVHGARLHVVDVTEDDPEELGSLDLRLDTVGELLLVGDRALVLGTSWLPLPSAGGTPEPGAGSVGLSVEEPALASPLMSPPGSAVSVLSVVDVSDPARPELVDTQEVQGSYLSAREHDGVVRVVLSHRPSLPFRYPDRPGAEAESAAANREVVAAADAQDWLPQRVVRGAAGEPAELRPLLDCTAVSHPAEPAGIGVVAVLTLDLAAPEDPVVDRVAVAADGDLVYASTERLYVATTRGGWGRPMPVDAMPVDVGRPVPGPAEATATQLHGFDISEPRGTSYVASGEVEGWLLGRWAMSEHDGLLRVATTRGDDLGDAAPGTDSAVTVLREQGERLAVVGEVAGLGKGEQIRAVRWFGDVATVVTFRQTDPLYTVDLSDPQAPAVLGELKVPGYSAYLHPLGDGLLLGVGQDATEEGMVLGAQVSTFDLADLTDPRRVDVLGVRDSWSDVESDSRQFTYLPEQRLAVLPLGTPRGMSLWAVSVGTDGALRPAGEWRLGMDGWLLRAVPVAGERLAVLSESSRGTRVTLLAADGLQELGAVRL